MRWWIKPENKKVLILQNQLTILRIWFRKTTKISKNKGKGRNLLPFFVFNVFEEIFIECIKILFNI